MDFIGRKNELGRMSEFFSTEGFEAGLVYGRRRVGKSELIKQAIRKNSTARQWCVIYYECKETTGQDNADQLSELAGEVLGFPKPAADNFEKALKIIFEQACSREIILVLDEYPYLSRFITGIDSIMQSLIDKHRGDCRLKMILCGSSVETMKSLLEKENPLYGRMSMVIDLKPMDYYESSLFYKSYSEEDKVRMYSCLGGIPYYNSLVDTRKSVRENIMRLVTSMNSRLESEIRLYLKSEISKIENANSVFEAIGKGYHKFSDIQSQAHIPSPQTLQDTLDKLMKIDLIAKEAPINDENNRKKTQYIISDNLSKFYFTYVTRHLSQRNLLSDERFYKTYVEKDFESQFVPDCFEKIVRQYLVRLNREDRIEPPILRLGKYYYDDPIDHTNGEFDVVAEDENGYIFYEVKFKEKPITQAVIDEEIEQVKKCGLNCYRYGFVSRSGFAGVKGDSHILIDIKELYLDDKKRAKSAL